MRKRRIAVGVVAGALVATGAWARIVVWPWFAAPDQAEVDRAWAMVGRAIAEVPKLHAGDEERFDEFASSLYGAKRDLDSLGRTENERTDETLPERVHASVEKLAVWAQTVGTADGQGPPCNMRDAGPLYMLPSLARMVLRAKPDEARVRTFVALSERLRRSGVFVHWVFGMEVLAAVLDWADASHAVPQFLVDTHADTRELRGALARDAKCIDGFFDGAPRASIAPPSSADSEYFPWYARMLIRPERERAMVRRQVGARLERCEAALDDAKHYLDCIDDQPTDMHEMPKSVAVRMTFLPVRLHDESKTLARYRALSK